MQDLSDRLFAEISKIRLIDPHTHINPLAAASTTLNDLLGYHYYTELAHSAGLPKHAIESAKGVELAKLLIKQLETCTNTVQYSWLIEIVQSFFNYQGDQIEVGHVDSLFAAAEVKMKAPTWTDSVFEKTGLEALFLTNDFDDPLEGFDTKHYIPCLRTDDLVFKLDQPSVQNRIGKATGLEWHGIEAVIQKLFEKFVAKGAKACAISLPPDFEPIRPTATEFRSALDAIGLGTLTAEHKRVVANGVFYLLADGCEANRLPFDLMIGVRRSVYEQGVYQGQDLFDQRTSLYLYRQLFNDKPSVTFFVSVLTHGQNQELTSYAWIFPNVVTSGHWWYSNIPIYIEADTRARLEAVPFTKQIGYYSDAYKLEFILPKFNMYRRCLARVLAQDFVIGRGWSEERAVALAYEILRGNVERIFLPNI
ncbi:amidohydrolase [bacterium]|nr:amidohydrolase [bacterium]